MVFELLSEKLQSAIKEKGFLDPTLPQKLGIPEILKGRNVLILAPTGLGKSETVLLPVFDMIKKNKSAPIAALYITPLKSLNRDMLSRFYWWADKLDLEIDVRHGDTSQTERAAQRENPSHILITTPETLQAILTGKKFREHLRNVKHVVIDEIHELVESKRGVQLSIALERLVELCGNFQRVGLSATVGSPELVAEFLGSDVKIIRAEAEKKYDIHVESPKLTTQDKEIAGELVIGENTTSRLRRLHELIKAHNSVLAFTNTRETAEVLSSRLRSLDKELKQAVHHGSLSKERRIESEKKFKNQELKSLIATSSLELGIDIGSIDLVVQYLSPRQVSRLIQRVGRAGHGIGRVSKGIIISGDEDTFESAVIAKFATERKLEKVKIHKMALDVLAMQILGVAMDEYGVHSDKVYEIITRAYPYKELEKKEFLEILKFLETIRIVWLNEAKGGYEIKRRKRAFTHYFTNLSTIPVTSQFKIVSIIQNEPIGNLDEAFVAEHGMPGNKFVCAGRAWKIIQVHGPKVIVEPVEDIESAIPAWEGELIPVPFEIAQEVGRLRNLVVNEKYDKIDEEFNIDKHTLHEMENIIKKHKQTHSVPDDKHFLMENYKDFIIIHSCCGSLVNDTLGKYIAALITAQTGVAVNIKIDPYRIMLQTIAKTEQVKNILQSGENMENILTASLERSSVFKWRFLHVARRFGIISRDAKYDKINMNKIIQNYVGTPAYRETIRELFHEKMDVEHAQEIIEMIKAGKIKMEIKEGLSHLGELGLVHQFSEVMKPRMPEKEIQNAFRRRLLLTKVRLVCANCGDFDMMMTVKNIEKEPECPKCGSRLLGVVRRSQSSASEIVKKKLQKKQLTEEELAEWQTIRRSADLTIVYGRRAIEALAGHGVGPQTAARILSMLHANKESFYKDVLAAEKQFAKTKIYWK